MFVNDKKIIIAALAATCLVCYTQFAHLYMVPGIHYDEAWQGIFANQILKSFQQGHPSLLLSAMNSYTTPIIHYLLALAFKFFGTSLVTMRITFAVMNLMTAGLISGFLWKMGEKKAVIWFLLQWALLPLSIHDHRFYIEVTCFHGFCFSIFLWGLTLWWKAPLLSFLLISGTILVGTYSHVLFVVVFLSSLFVLASSHPREFQSIRSQILIAFISLALIPQAFRMGIGLHRALPIFLVGGLILIAVWALLFPRWIRFQFFWEHFPRMATRLSPLILIVSIPYLIAYVGLLWNGLWPYAQMTGQLRLWWIPFNAILFLSLMSFQLWKKLRVHAQETASLLSPHVTWGAFVATFLISSLLILKQTSRYYMVPTLIAMMWSSQRLARLQSQKWQCSIASIFILWNLWAFHFVFLHDFERIGPVDGEFKLWIFHDTGRDFRPFQKVFAWAVEKNCQNDLNDFGQDRFEDSIRFLQLTARLPQGACAWSKNKLVLTHILDFDPRTYKPSESLQPPAKDLKFLAYEPGWGDLAFWVHQ